MYARKSRVLSDERIKPADVDTECHCPKGLRPVTGEVEIKKKTVKTLFIADSFEWPASTTSHSACAQLRHKGVL
ncbi:MAG: hypothetical protein MJ202_11285 [Lentisphaeria bacterium]|nr:hypothetical protein [Lentisphaeria bacterium]